MAEMTLVVLAAGMGSRYGGMKQVEPVGPGGETILDYSVYDAIGAGFDRVVFVIREEMRAEFVEKVSGKFAERIAVGFAYQRLDDVPPGSALPPGREKPWGTAQAVLAAREVVDSPFAVLNADDFYGRDAFVEIARFLRERAAPAGAAPAGGGGEYAMVGFTLRKTLSEHGSVARGICSADAGGFLQAVEELTAIVPVLGGGARNESAEAPRELTGDEVASMNFWGFTPDVFPLMWDGFADFLAGPGDPLRKEFYIPTVIDRMIADGSARVSVLRSDGDWFGVTYREDREAVAAALAKLGEAGDYPVPLWQSERPEDGDEDGGYDPQDEV
ncbi:nucleotidyltransferase [soil metagenome]